jgi:putative ABC transport system permease protein
MRNIWNDLRFALRQLRRNPGFAITAVLTLALGIGANTAIFSLLDQALLRALPVRDPGSLVILRDSTTAWSGSIMTNGGELNDYFSYPQYLALRDQGHDFSGLVATSTTPVGFKRGKENTQFATTELVSGNYFQTLGVPAVLGRTLLPSDDGAPGANPVAVLSYSFWRNKLGGDPSITGSTVTVSGHPFTVIGVAAPHFESAIWGQKTDLFEPISMVDQTVPQAGNRFPDHSSKWLNILGRLRPGVTISQANIDNAPLWHAFRQNDARLLGIHNARTQQRFLNSNLEFHPGARGFNFNRSALETPFLAVMAMAALVLLIAAVNVASLLMVRSAGRAREFSLRAALGASASRIVSQLLLEGVLIGLFGGTVGVLFAPFALRVLVSRLSDPAGNSAFTTSIDPQVLLFTFLVAVAVSLLFSLVPALQYRRPNLTSTLRESTGTGGSALLRLRRVVVCLQIGLSVVLLVVAGLFIRTMQQLRSIDFGFNTTHLVMFNTDPQLSGYSAAATPAVQQRVLDGLAPVPGILSVAASDGSALTDNGSDYGITVSRYQPPANDSYSSQVTTATPNYLSTMQIPLIAGRGLAETDTPNTPRVALVNQTFVNHYCHGDIAACIGRSIGLSRRSNMKDALQVVGVFRDYRSRSVTGEIPSTVMRALKQTTVADMTGRGQLFFYLRTALPPAATFSTIGQAMHRIDPALGYGTPLVSMDQQIDIDLQNQSMIELLAISFGALATILAGVGLYGVLAYSTSQRTREIGIRMALGSTRAAVSLLVLKDVFRLAALGVLVAVPVAYGLSILIQSQLYGVNAANPAILLSVVGIIAFVALLSAVFPARRAASISPTEALRIE